MLRDQARSIRSAGSLPVISAKEIYTLGRCCTLTTALQRINEDESTLASVTRLARENCVVSTRPNARLLCLSLAIFVLLVLPPYLPVFRCGGGADAPTLLWGTTQSLIRTATG